MAKVTVFSYDDEGVFFDGSMAIDLCISYTVEAQRVTGIAPRENDISIRRISVSGTDAPAGVDPLHWASMASSLEVVLNDLVEHRPDVQESLEQDARNAWERHDVGIISVSGDESNTDTTDTKETSF